MINQSYNWNDSQTKAVEVKRLPLQASTLFPLELPVLFYAGLMDSKKILDFGCGDGTWGSLLTEALEGAQVVGADKSPELIQKARETNSTGEYYVIDDSAKLPSLLNFVRPDTVIARFVCQHLPAPECATFMKDVRRTLPDSRLLIIDAEDRSFSLDSKCDAFFELAKKKGDRQRLMGGDREIGRKLVSLMAAAGFVNIHESTIRIHSKDIGFDRWQEMVFPVIFHGALEEDASLIEEVKAWGAAAHRDAYFDIYVASAKA